MQSFTTQRLEALFTFPFRGPRWQEKLLIGALISLIPILSTPLVFGYCAQMARRIIHEGAESFLPEWDDWSRLLLDGLRVFLVVLVYVVPLIALMFAAYFLFMTPAIAAGVLSETNSRDVPPFFPLFVVLVTFGGMALFGLVFLIAMIAGFVLPAPMMHVVVKEDFLAAFRVGEWWPIFRANLGGFVVSYVLILGVSFVAGFLVQILYFTIVLCCLAPLALAVHGMYLTLMMSALYAQAYRFGAQRAASAGSAV